MILLYKGRVIEEGKNYHIYRNLNNGLFSVKNSEGLVCAHVDNVITCNNTFKVRENARQKVIENKQRSVHAWVVFDYIYVVDDKINVNYLDQLYYNPYELDCFINKTTSEKLEFAHKIYFNEGRAYIID